MTHARRCRDCMWEYLRASGTAVVVSWWRSGELVDDCGGRNLAILFFLLYVDGEN
jgi:hypothetical protein